MSSGMNRAQAEEYAKTMTYKQAIINIRTGKGVMYRKATMIKLHELAEIADKLVLCKDCRYFKKIAERSDSGLCHRDIVASAWKENGYCSRGERREESEVEE